jgi:hypothetical protein
MIKFFAIIANNLTIHTGIFYAKELLYVLTQKYHKGFLIEFNYSLRNSAVKF